MINRSARVAVWNDTVNICVNGQFKNLIPEKSTYFRHNDKAFSDLVLEKKYQTAISVVNADVLLVAQTLEQAGEKNPLVLNLASYKHFLGGVVNGAMAQEEELGRRTNYLKADSEKFYPMQKMESIYTPGVTVIKDQNYEVLSNPFSVSMLAAAAIKGPELLENGEYNSWDYQTTCNIIDNIFKVALLKKHDVLVLGALGCGAYGNNPIEVVKIFNIYLEKYDGCFKTIVFAVFSRSDNNYDIFNAQIKRTF